MAATTRSGDSPSGGRHDRAAFLRGALGDHHQPLQQPSSGTGRAWNRDEAMALLEQHEWNRANANTANTMADQLNARYGPVSGRSPVNTGGRSRVASGSSSGSGGGGGVRGRNGHPVDCRGLV